MFERLREPPCCVGGVCRESRTVGQLDIGDGPADATDSAAAHQGAEALGGEQVAAALIAYGPAAVVDEAELVHLNLLDGLAEHALHRIAEERFYRAQSSHRSLLGLPRRSAGARSRLAPGELGGSALA